LQLTAEVEELGLRAEDKRVPTPVVAKSSESKGPLQEYLLKHAKRDIGKGEPVTELSWHSCRQLLYQAVATILAHAGFECANESVLETLTDFTKLLRSAVDREARLGQTPFPDVMEQVFHEVGIGSVLSLQEFWQHRIKDYHTYMLQISKQLSEEYERIVNPEKATEDTKPVKIKEEPVSDITFPVSEELEADLASGDQSLPNGVLGAQSKRFPSNLEVEASPQASRLPERPVELPTLVKPIAEVSLRSSWLLTFLLFHSLHSENQ
ncbi:hypothetical protein U0070_000976, partial [Myodes glareolus]